MPETGSIAVIKLDTHPCFYGFTFPQGGETDMSGVSAMRKNKGGG